MIKLLKKVTLLKRIYEKLVHAKQRIEFSGLNNEEVFTKIYQSKEWDVDPKKGNVYFSGLGSYGRNAEDYVKFINGFIKDFKITSVTDIGCGDFAIGSQIIAENKNVQYSGCDVVKEVIDFNIKKYGSDTVFFYHSDATKNELPISDLLTIRQVLQHLSNKDIIKILDRVKNYRFVLITEHLLKEGTEKSINKDKIAGPNIRLAFSSGVYLDQPPFNKTIKEVLSCREDIYGKEAYLKTYLIRNDL